MQMYIPVLQEAEPEQEVQLHSQLAQETDSWPLSTISQLVGAALSFPALAGSLAVAFAVTSAVLMTHAADARDVPLDVYTVPFALAIFVYAYDSIRDSSTVEATPVRREEILRQERIYRLSMLGALGFLTVRLCSAQWHTTRIVLLILGLAWMYTAKCIPLPQLHANGLSVRWSNLKGVPLLKNLVVPALWGCAATFLTEALLRENGVHEIDSATRNTMWLFIFLYDFSVVIIHNDCRDYFEDVKSGVSTIPTVFGIRSSLLFAETLLLCLYAASSLAFFCGHQISSDFLGVPFSLDVEVVGLTLGLVLFLPSDIIPFIEYSRSGFNKLSDEGQLRVERMSLVKPWQGIFLLVIFLVVNATLEQQ